jgi:hypothetical protein
MPGVALSYVDWCDECLTVQSRRVARPHLLLADCVAYRKKKMPGHFHARARFYGYGEIQKQGKRQVVFQLRGVARRRSVVQHRVEGQQCDFMLVSITRCVCTQYPTLYSKFR